MCVPYVVVVVSSFALFPHSETSPHSKTRAFQVRKGLSRSWSKIQKDLREDLLHDARTRSETVKNAMKMFYRLLLLEQRGQDVNTFVSSELMSQLNRTRSLLLRVSSGNVVQKSVTKEKSVGKEEKDVDENNEVEDEETRSHRRVEMLRRFKRSIREKQKNVAEEKEEELKVDRIAMGSSIIEEEKEEVVDVDNTPDDDVFFSIGNGGDALPLQF